MHAIILDGLWVSYQMVDLHGGGGNVLPNQQVTDEASAEPSNKQVRHQKG